MRGLAILCLLSILFSGCATSSPSKSKSQKRADAAAARVAAVDWLKRLDEGDYEEAFEWEAQDFRMTRTQKQFVRYMQARRVPFGHAISRTCIGAAAIPKMAGLPDGEYQSLIFKSAFENKSPTAERVILVKQAVGWRVIDYRIY